MGKKTLLGAGALAAAAALTFSVCRVAVGSDHAGTVESVKKPGIDFSDLHIFPSPTNPANVVLAMSVHPLIPAGKGQTVFFDTNVLYQFKIDTTNDGVEDLVLQAKFDGTGSKQRVRIAGPVKPSRLGTTTKFESGSQDPTVGFYNSIFPTTSGMTVFAGPRKDPFFIDLEQLFAILPDRGSPVFPNLAQPPGQANTPRSTTFRGFPGQPAAVDFLANYNVLAIVVELPRTKLADPTTGQIGKIGVWETASVRR